MASHTVFDRQHRCRRLDKSKEVLSFLHESQWKIADPRYYADSEIALCFRKAGLVSRKTHPPYRGETLDISLGLMPYTPQALLSAFFAPLW
jgi:hypothetical protein